MQGILAIVSTISALIFIYLIANLLLQLHGEKASAKQKGIFAFLIGGILNQAWTYAIYFIGGMQSFSELVYALVVTPNPIFAILYYFIGVKVLHLTRIRSIKLMRYVYLYYIIIKSFNRLFTSIFFVQPPGRYNYMLATVNQLALFVIVLIAYFATKKALEHYKYSIKLNLFLNFKRELATYFIHATGIYLIMVGIPLIISERIAANLVILLLFVQSFALTVIWDMFVSARNEIQNRSAHISVLSRGILMDDTGDLFELRQKMNENPSLISMLIGKHDYAEKLGVKMNVALQSRLDHLNMDNVDACVVVSCLLDNAIEAAANSTQRKVTYTVESKADGGKLMIISNSIATPIDTDKILFQGVTTKQGHQGNGGAAIRKIILKYGNCSIQHTRDDHEVSAYLEIK